MNAIKAASIIWDYDESWYKIHNIDHCIDIQNEIQMIQKKCVLLSTRYYFNR
jgi:hypothetical protein